MADSWTPQQVKEGMEMLEKYGSTMAAKYLTEKYGRVFTRDAVLGKKRRIKYRGLK